MRNLELEPGQRRCVIVRRLFCDVLVREHVPVVLRPDRDTGTFGSMPCTTLRHCIGDLPQVRRDLGFLPVTLVIMPMVTTTDLHASILLLAEFLIPVITFRQVFFLSYLFCFRFHYFQNLVSPLSGPNTGSFTGTGTLLIFSSVFGLSPGLP